MAKGELLEDLENLKCEYRLKITAMSEKFKNNEYHYKTRNKMAELLASYMSSLDELEQLTNLRYEASRNNYFKPSKYEEYKQRILSV